MRTLVVVGNPKPRSRTFAAAEIVAERLTGRPPDLSIDVVAFGPELLDFSSAVVGAAVADVRGADLLVVASPTYKATYTGLLKLFLDRIGTGALAGVTAVPLMLGGDYRHSLAPEVFLKPLLVELGATCPTSGLFLTEAEYAASERLDAWLAAATPAVAAATGA